MPGGVEVDVWNGSARVATAIEKLERTIAEFNEAANKQTREMLVLTRLIAFLTAVMLVGLGVQLWLAFDPPGAGKSQATQPVGNPAGNVVLTQPRK